MPLSAILPPLIGGALIGAAATLLLWLNGEVAGVSGICGATVRLDSGRRRWQLAFVAGLLVVGLVLIGPLPEAFVFGVDRSLGAVAAAGLLVGIGTQMSRGCTSGHGVCGLSRLSKRSLVATLTFMFTGGLSAFVVNHLMGGAL